MRPHCQSFAELTALLGDIAGERVGDWLRNSVVAVLGSAGDAFLDSGWLLEWEGWEDLREKLLMHNAADWNETDTIFEAWLFKTYVENVAFGEGRRARSKSARNVTFSSAK